MEEYSDAKDGIREEVVEEYWKKFMEYMADDLSTPQALTVLWDVIKSDLTKQEKYELLMRFDRILGLGLDRIKKQEVPEEVKRLVEEREKSRAAKDWRKADEIRERIRKMGWHIEDTEGGPKLRRLR